MLNGETLQFDQAGNFIDGQHRLSAVIAADVAVQTVVMRDVDTGVMDTSDVGAKRTYADALKVQGEDNTTTLTAGVRRAAMWQRGARKKHWCRSPNRPEDEQLHRRKPTDPSVGG